MSYHEALEAAGATVHAFQEFGSYQGDWWAKVTYQDNRGWVHGSYGSCSGCDAFQGEFDYATEKCEEHRYEYCADTSACEGCKSAIAEYQSRLADFGRGYIEGCLMSQEEAEKDAGQHAEWDSGAPAMLEFVKSNSLSS
jgi:hypothetical protein